MHDDILDTIESFYACVGETFDFDTALSRFSRATDETSYCLLDFKLSGPHTLFSFVGFPDEAMLTMLKRQWTSENHGIYGNFSKIPNGIPLLHRAVESDDSYYRSELYKLAMAPWGLHSIGVCFLKKNAQGGLINGFGRKPDQAEIGPELLALMSVLNNHLLRAINLNWRMDRIETALVRANSVLDLIDFGLVLYGTSQSAIFVNAAARRIFEQKDGLVLEKTGLVPTDREAQRVFTALLEEVQREDQPMSARVGGVVSVPRPSKKKPYGLMTVPMNGAGRRGPDAAGTAVMIFDPEAKRTSVPDLFANAYGFTGAESRLATALAEGSSLEDYANANGISRNTAKSHLHAVFAKTETSRQHELVSLLLRSMAGINFDF